MLALPTRTQGGLLAIDDASSGRTHVALTQPRLARRDDGTSRLRLLRWASANGAGPASGGRLTLDIETFPLADELTRAGFVPEQTFPLPWLDATVRVEGPRFEPIEAAASIALGTAASVAADISPAAAAILAPLLQAGGVAPLQVHWTGHVLVRLPPVEVTAIADIREVRRRIEIVQGTTQSIVNRSVVDANARIEIHGAGNAALEQALRDWAIDELTSRLEKGQSLDVHASASDVVRWPVQLSATLDDLNPGTGSHALVETVLLDEQGLGHTPPIEVRAVADFSRGLERIDVSLAALDGSRTQDVALLDDDAATVALGSTDFRWRHRTKLTDRQPSGWSEWQTVRAASHLLVPVQLSTVLRIEVLAVGLDFTKRWASVQVVLTHQIPEAAPDTDTLELTARQTGAIWTKAIDGVRGTVAARLVFTSYQGQVVEQTVPDVDGDQLVVLDPFESARVGVALVPVGTGWSTLEMAMVDLRYVDGAHTIDETVELRSLDDFLEWEAPARADGPKVVRWRLHASFKDGRYHSTEWQDSPAGAIVVRIDAAPRREVQVLPMYFDASVTRKGTLRLRSGSQVETVAVADRAPRSVVLPAGPFTWTLAWTAADGTELAESIAVEGDDVIVVPRFEAR